MVTAAIPTRMKLTDPWPYRSDMMYTIPKNRMIMIGMIKFSDCSLEYVLR
jgi:hypothetical protein